MSVSNGQAVSAEVTNPAFVSQKIDSQMLGKLDLKTPTGSGAFVLGLQQVINNLISVAGMLNQNNTALDYPSNNFVTDGSSLKAAIGQIDVGLKSVQNSFANIFAADNTWSGSNTFAGIFNFDSVVNSTATGSDAIITSPAKTVVRLTSPTLLAVGGIATPTIAISRILIIYNGTGNGLTLKHLSATVPSGQKISSPSNADVTLVPGASTLLYYDLATTTWSILSGGGGTSGGGGAGALSWNAPEGEGAQITEENGIKVYTFENQQLLFQKIVAFVQVPSSYKAGIQPKVRLVSYSAGVNYHAYRVNSYLVKPVLQSVGDSTYVNTVKSGDFGGVGPNLVRAVDVPLSDLNGKVGGADILSDDYLRIEILRVAPTGTASTEDTKMVFGSMGVTFV